MRTFFVFLFVLNLVFAAWQYFQPAKTAAQVKPLPGSLNTIQLVNEAVVEQLSPQNITEQVIEQSEKIDETPVSSPAIDSCYTLGPFKDEESVNNIKKQLAESLDDLAVRKIEESAPHRYWIFIPSLANRNAAIAKSKELAKKKVKDYYIVRKGENNNAISLGHFREKSHADRRVKKLNKLGFQANLKVIYRSYNLYWLDYVASGSSQEHDALIAGFSIEGVSRLNRACQ